MNFFYFSLKSFLKIEINLFFFSSFLKGNSNSFVTIDISTGFVGLFFYNPFIHGILIYFSIYGLSIQWLRNLSIDQRKDSLKQMTLINCLFIISMIVQRSHLFLWTVFTPKLFYLFAQTFSFLFLFLFIQLEKRKMLN